MIIDSLFDVQLFIGTAFSNDLKGFEVVILHSIIPQCYY